MTREIMAEVFHARPGEERRSCGQARFSLGEQLWEVALRALG